MSYEIGNKYETSKCGTVELVEILEGNQYVIEFEGGYRKTVNRKVLLTGKIKNPYAKSVYGVGVLGEGFKCSINGKRTEEYASWMRMMHRCYSGLDLSYVGRYVNDEWHYFQNFAAWCQDQRGFGIEGWQLDKDLLIRGNREYSSDACLFLPSSINSALTQYSSDDVRKGVSRNAVYGGYQVGYYNTDKKVRTTKSFTDEEEAFAFYHKTRFDFLKLELEIYKDSLDPRAVIRIQDVISEA